MKKIVIASIATLALSSAVMAAVPGMCMGCHGKNGEKNTVNKAMVPDKLTKAEMTTKLEAYRAGTEGTAMKSFAKRLTDAQIKDISNTWGK